jgi:benzoylsuccinyl-CoA thiolase BbsB subunit
MFGKMPDKTIAELGSEAVSEAYNDAGLNPRDIQVAYACRQRYGRVTAQSILKMFGVTGIEMINVENACAGGLTAVRCLWKDIATGIHDIGIAIGVESMTTLPTAGTLIRPADEDLNGQLGMTMPGLFGLIGRRMMETRGFTREDLAYVSVKNHRHACLNPKAQYQKELTMEDVLKSRMIADPITMLQCCPQTDGAAAVVMCSKDVAKKYTTKLVKIVASTIGSGDFATGDYDPTVLGVEKKLAKKAYEMAGVGPEDLDVIELHDAFSCEEIMHYEGLGLCDPEGGLDFLRSGAPEIGGKIPVNPSGGLLSLGHPLGASGVRVICEIALQLRGEAGKRQIPKAKVGLAQMLGGVETGLELAAASIHILMV